MKNSIILAMFFLLLSHKAFAVNPPIVNFTPTLPANCYDGIPHTNLHAVIDVVPKETDEDVSVSFRTFTLDCHYRDGNMYASFYGPFHKDRCDHSIRPYSGVRVNSKLLPLAPFAPFDKINICSVEISFDKKYLQKDEANQFQYIYRYNSMGGYIWLVDVSYDAVANHFATKMVQTMVGSAGPDRAANSGVIGDNLDRETGPRHLECNASKMGYYRSHGIQGFGMEAPYTEVRGSPEMLHVEFYVTGLTCSNRVNDEATDIYTWRRDSMIMGDTVVIRNSAHSEAGYDWNIYRMHINRNLIENKVFFDMPLAEVMTDDQLELFHKGDVASVYFKVYINDVRSSGSSGYINLYLNLDPRAKLP